MIFRKLQGLRARLSAPGRHSWGDIDAFAKSVLSMRDIALLRALIRRPAKALSYDGEINTIEGDNSGNAALATLTSAGYCDLVSDIRPWLSMEDYGDAICTAGPLVLCACAKDFGDGTALRVLLEFADSRNTEVRLNLDRAVEHYSQSEIDRLLTRTRTDQISTLLPESPAVASNRVLWVLKTFIDDPRVSPVLTHCAQAGYFWALMSLLFADSALDWELFDLAQPFAEDEHDCYVNAMLRNISMGADPAYWKKSELLRRFPHLADEFQDGMTMINDDREDTSRNF